MLAKVWKKILLAICLVACIYNVMHKLINVTSLEKQLKSVQNSNSILEENINNTNMVNNSKTTNEDNIQENNMSKNNEVKNTDTNTIVVIY